MIHEGDVKKLKTNMQTGKDKLDGIGTSFECLQHGDTFNRVWQVVDNSNSCLRRQTLVSYRPVSSSSLACTTLSIAVLQLFELLFLKDENSGKVCGCATSPQCQSVRKVWVDQSIICRHQYLRWAVFGQFPQDINA
ncbi:hypothetical protein J6590_054136 [Homalodisca vitripennis]|nr:hypothetical protein J6590_054136 [Homalodisca vitripennis]